MAEEIKLTQDEAPESRNFIHAFIEEDIGPGGQFEGMTVHTRFPPEPNGYLHIGHCKALTIDFGTAEKFGGLCNLRMDDTNPTKEDEEFVDAIQQDIHWLGFDWGDRFFYGSDYFDEDYRQAVGLIKKGLAYVCELTPEQFKEYRRRRDAFIANLEAEKEANLKVKQAIIEELKELVNSDETLNHTFNKFRELQQRWKDTGIVPQQHVKDLWETYNLHVENFYSFIKINKELRDLDLKKNYEQKVALCEQAEALVLEPSVVEAFHKLQKLHDEWRETGPVANEYKEALWERFKAASSRINKQHQEHFETLKGEQVKNLELKTGLCVATEELSSQPLTTRKEWNRASDRLLEIQKTWKTIGFAPKKDNNRIYERFRTACDRFFEAKRQFYAGMKTEMEHNLQLKIEICEAAESLMNSEEWKKATDELIALQARWKQIGAVSRRHSDAVWKRFRAACDKFFERKASHFASVDGEHEENLQKKLALLAEMAGADVKAGGYEVIREFQRRWGEIGFVPIKQKDAIQKKYKAAVDELFNTLRGSERDRSMGRFREKVSSFKASGDRRLRSERERLYNKVRQLEQEIGLLENNIGFFAKSKNAEALIADVKAKIERAREDMAAAIEKVKLIDRQAQEENHENNDNK
mgnify:CR=1 FL=1